MRIRIGIVAAVAIAGCVLAFLLPPLEQPLEYHHFADRRSMFGVPNFLDTISNVPFLIPGILGLLFLWRRRDPVLLQHPSERLAYTIVFLGTSLTCFGSAWYHLWPDNSGLFWDRLPMTIVFMSLLAAVIGERLSSIYAGILLGPLLLAGGGSVLYWRWTEMRGMGNLWPYAAAQYLSLLIVLLLIGLFPPRYTRGRDLGCVIAVYALAKVAEAADGVILSSTRIVSGHTLKHLLAAYAAWRLLSMLRLRQVSSFDRQ
jgi:hypothetical protein